MWIMKIDRNNNNIDRQYEGKCIIYIKYVTVA